MLDSQEFQGTRVAQWGVMLDVKPYLKGPGIGAANQRIEVTDEPPAGRLVPNGRARVLRTGTQVVDK